MGYRFSARKTSYRNYHIIIATMLFLKVAMEGFLNRKFSSGLHERKDHRAKKFG